MDDKLRPHWHEVELNNFTDIGYHARDTPAVSTGVHRHKGYEIIQTWSDSGYVLISDNIYPMKKGNLYIINALQPHCTNQGRNIPYIRSKITFSSYYLRMLLVPIGHLEILDPVLGKINNFTPMIAQTRKKPRCLTAILHRSNGKAGSRMRDIRLLPARRGSAC